MVREIIRPSLEKLRVLFRPFIRKLGIAALDNRIVRRVSDRTRIDLRETSSGTSLFPSMNVVDFEMKSKVASGVQAEFRSDMTSSRLLRYLP
jgi:hypothetical protein